MSVNEDQFDFEIISKSINVGAIHNELCMLDAEIDENGRSFTAQDAIHVHEKFLEEKRKWMKYHKKAQETGKVNLREMNKVNDMRTLYASAYVGYISATHSLVCRLLAIHAYDKEDAYGGDESLTKILRHERVIKLLDSTDMELLKMFNAHRNSVVHSAGVMICPPVLPGAKRQIKIMLNMVDDLIKMIVHYCFRKIEMYIGLGETMIYALKSDMRSDSAIRQAYYRRMTELEAPIMGGKKGDK